MDVPCSRVSACLLEEDDPVDKQRLRGFHDGAGCQRTAAGIGVLYHNDFQVFLLQVGPLDEGQVDAGIGIRMTGEQLSIRRIPEQEAIV